MNAKNAKIRKMQELQKCGKGRNCNENEDAMNAQRHRNEKLQRNPTEGRMQSKRTKQILQRKQRR